MPTRTMRVVSRINKGEVLPADRPSATVDFDIPEGSEPFWKSSLSEFASRFPESTMIPFPGANIIYFNSEVMDLDKAVRIVKKWSRDWCIRSNKAT